MTEKRQNVINLTIKFKNLRYFSQKRYCFWIFLCTFALEYITGQLHSRLEIIR